LKKKKRREGKKLEVHQNQAVQFKACRGFRLLYFCDVPNTASTRRSYSAKCLKFHTPSASKAFPPQKPAKLPLTYQFSAPASVARQPLEQACFVWRVCALIIEGCAGRSKCGEGPGQLYVVDQIDCEDCHDRHPLQFSLQPLEKSIV
jgi:hypothetical protein